MREFLPVGGVLMTGDKNCSFAIMDTIAYGGTSLIYRVEIPGTCRTFILKEFFPVSSEVYRYKRQDYNVVSDFSDKKKSHMCEMHLEQLWKQENEIGQRLGRKTIREAGSLITLDITCLLYENIEYPLKNQHFLLLDDLTGKGAFLSDFIEEAQKPAQEGYPVRRGGLPSIHLTSKIMSEITRAIIDIHKEGMIYGDVQPGNVYFLGGDVREGYVGIGIFLDYGTCRFREKDGETPIMMSSIHYKVQQDIIHRKCIPLLWEFACLRKQISVHWECCFSICCVLFRRWPLLTVCGTLANGRYSKIRYLKMW